MATDHLPAGNTPDGTEQNLDLAKAESLKQFIEQVGGIEKAREAIEVLAEMERRAA